MKNKIPYFAIGNEELAKKKSIGKIVTCRCGKRHKVRFGETVHKDGTKTPDKMLGFIRCGKKSYLASIDGKKL